MNEKEKNKSNIGIIIVLIIMLIGAFCYIAYDKFISKTDTKVNTTVNKDEMYKKYIKNIKTRPNAISVVVSSNETGDKAIFILGTDNKIYLETYDDDDTKIPGAVGPAGDYTGQYIGIDNVVRIFDAYHTPFDGGSYNGMLILKEDGNLYILRNPADEDYKLEKLENKNIVTTYNVIDEAGTTYVVDISGNSFAIK